MEINYEKIDELTMALLFLGYDERTHRAWKSFNWEILNRLHAKGLIDNPVNTNKSVVFSEAGAQEAKKLFEKFFSK